MGRRERDGGQGGKEEEMERGSDGGRTQDHKARMKGASKQGKMT